jgi:hypothetical protein
VFEGPAAPGAFGRWAAQQARSFEPELVHERHALPDGAGDRLGTGFRLLEVNAPLTWEGALFRGRRASRASLGAELRALRRADAVAVVSPALRDWAARHGVQAHLTPNGVASHRRSKPRSEAFVLGFEGSFKPWHGLLEAVPSLDLLAARVAPQPLLVELVGDGPTRPALQAALPTARWLGELDEAALAQRRHAWSAAWSTAAPWPPDGPIEELEQRLGEALPGRWFAPLKEAEAAAAGLPVWAAGPEFLAAGPRPPSWAELARRFLSMLAGGDELWDDGLAR